MAQVIRLLNAYLVECLKRLFDHPKDKEWQKGEVMFLCVC